MINNSVCSSGVPFNTIVAYFCLTIYCELGHVVKIDVFLEIVEEY